MPCEILMSLKKIPKGVFALGFVSLFMDLSSEMIHSILPIFMVSALGVSALAVGIVEGIAEATASIVKIFSGAFSDWIGKRKPLLLAGYGLALVARPLFPLAQSIEAVLLARFSDRIGKGIRTAPRDAFIADITPKEVQGEAYGLRQSLDNIGAVLGPMMAMILLLLTFNDFRFVLWAALVPGVLCVLTIIFFVKEPARKKEQEEKGFPLKKSQIKKLSLPFWMVTGIGSILMMARFSDAFLVLRADSVGLVAALAPTILIAMNVVYASSSWPAGALADRIGKSALLLFGIGVLILADIVLAAAHTAPMVYLGACLWGLHMGLTQGIITAYVAAEAPASMRGTAFGIYNLVTGVTLLFASLLAGWLWKDHGPAFTFGAGAVFSLIALVGFAALQPRFRKKDI